MTLLDDLLERLETSTGCPVVVSDQELDDWSESERIILSSRGFIERTTPPTHTVCNGCEEYCSRPVEHIGSGSDTRFFVICDQRTDINRVEIPRRALELWQCSGSQMAKAIATMLGITPPFHPTDQTMEWTIGVVRGSSHSSHTTVDFGNGAVIKTAGRSVPLNELLWIQDSGIYLDKGRLISLVDQPIAPGGDEESAKQRGLRLLERKNQLKSKGVKNFIQLIADEEHISKSRVRQIIDPVEKRKNNLARWPIAAEEKQ